MAAGPNRNKLLFIPSKATAALRVPGHIGSASVQFLVDAGAVILVARFDVIPDPLRTLISYFSDITAVSASGHLLDVVGNAILPLTVGYIELKHEFTIVRSLTVDCLLSVDFLTGNSATVDCVKGCLTLATEEIPFSSTISKLTKDHNQQNHSSKTAGLTFSVTVLETVEIQCRSVQFITASLHTALDPSFPTEGLIEPAQPPSIPKHIMFARSLSAVDNGNCVIIQVMNISPGNITLCKVTPLGEFTPMHDLFVVDSNYDTQTEHFYG